MTHLGLKLDAAAAALDLSIASVVSTAEGTSLTLRVVENADHPLIAEWLRGFTVLVYAGENDDDDVWMFHSHGERVHMGYDAAAAEPLAWGVGGGSAHVCELTVNLPRPVRAGCAVEVQLYLNTLNAPSTWRNADWTIPSLTPNDEKCAMDALLRTTGLSTPCSSVQPQKVTMPRAPAWQMGGSARKRKVGA